jgi:hypothetical protein
MTREKDVFDKMDEREERRVKQVLRARHRHYMSYDLNPLEISKIEDEMEEPDESPD